MRKVVLAFDSFKGCLTSGEVAGAVAEGVRRRYADVVPVPLVMSDGGDGMLDAFAAAVGARVVRTVVHDPLMRLVEARYALADDGHTAIVEMAEASGLHRLSRGERNPLVATSFGTGELIAEALRKGCRRVVVGLGGSGTSDAGIGMLQALGMTVGTDGECPRYDFSALMPELRTAEFVVASDVRNPLLGADGAAHVFAPQKGATPVVVEQLEQRARMFARAVAAYVGRDCASEAGAGAAGGVGFALMALTSCRMESGAELLMRWMDFDRLLADADLVLTGEGRSDRQTLMGKLPQVVLRHAQRCGVPVDLRAGQICDADRLLAAGFRSLTSINPPDLPLSLAMRPEVARRQLMHVVLPDF